MILSELEDQKYDYFRNNQLKGEVFNKFYELVLTSESTLITLAGKFDI